MEKDDIDQLFGHLEGGFDTETPPAGHEARFLNKLAQQKNKTTVHRTPVYKLRNVMAIAASIVLLLGLGWVLLDIPSSPGATDTETREETTYPELARTQHYFSSLIENELKKIKEEANTEDTRIIVNDAIIQLEQIESDYEKLEEELQKNGYSKQLLNAMITNFQTRITLLQHVMEQIEDTKKLKTERHEENRI